MHREHGDSEDRQGMHQLVGHTSLEDRQIVGRQPAFQAVGGESAQGHTGEAEKGGKHQEAAKHGTTPCIGSV
ncbi:hypothetical protein D3C71_1708410 [compost metagenome]